MNKKLAFALSLISISSYAQAFAGVDPGYDEENQRTTAPSTSNVNVDIGGTLDVQYAYIKQKGVYRLKDPSDNTSGKVLNNGILTNNKLEVKVNAKADNGLKYGAKIVLNANTSKASAINPSSNVANKLVLFAEHDDYGRLEGGDYKGASGNMKVSGASIAKAAGGIDGELDNFFNLTTVDGQNTKDVFVFSPNPPIGCDCSTKAGKINYYTPLFNGFQFGISYTPDLAIKGTSATMNDAPKEFGYKRIFETGVTYETTLNEITFKGSLVGQFGKARNGVGTDSTVSQSELQRRNLKAWEIGTNVSYNEFMFGASYGDWGNSGVAREKEAGKKYGAKYYTLGVAYTKNDFGASITYFNGKRAGGIDTVDAGSTDKNSSKNYPLHESGYNKSRALSFGLEYVVAPGLMPYAEYTYFNFKRADVTANARNRGSLFLTGLKVSF